MLMLLGRELPTWEQIIKKGRGNTERPYMAGENDLMLANSWMSIRLIADAVRAVKADFGRIVFWLPDYFCNETLCCFRRDYMDMVYYPIDENMEPDWSRLRAMIKDETSPKPDVILMAHYFGIYHDVAKMRDLANNTEAVLIEDCAHCLYPHPLGQIGQKGDFVIYSQHKQLPISDGAILKANPEAAKKDLRDQTEAVWRAINEAYEKLQRRPDMNGWYMKKGIQKATHTYRSLTYSYGVHIGGDSSGISLNSQAEPTRIDSSGISLNSQAKLVRIGGDEQENLPVERISGASERILAGYSYEDYKRIAYLRRDNLRIMNAEVKKRIPGIRIINEPSETEIPYMGVYSMADLDEKEKKAAVDKLLKDDFTVLYWPDLPSELGRAEADHSRAFALSRDIFVIPAIHQDIRPQQLVKKFGYASGTEVEGLVEAGPTSIMDAEKGRLPKVREAKLRLIWEQDMTRAAAAEITGEEAKAAGGISAEECKREWDKLWQTLATTNIPQDYIYGNAKSKTEGWGLKRAVIKNEAGETVGLIQVLMKKIGGISVAARVNRGPLLLPEYDCIENQLQVMRALRSKIPHPLPIAWAPFAVWTPKHMSAITAAGWRATDPYAYPSGYLDLTQSEEDIEKNMKSFWRKHIKQARKLVTIRINQYSAAEVMSLYAQFLKRRQIPGIPDHILKYLFALDEPPLEVLTAHNDKDEMIAYKVLYRHGNTGTSFIAWNTDEGRDKQARTLLIFTSALHLKSLGCTYYDLGGIDDITTEAVAKYKRGTGDTDYRLQGEFIAV